jgi:biopolymer transport protein ExbB/TolQ
LGFIDIPVSPHLMGSSRRLQKLRKREWEFEEDPLSVPKLETIQRRQENEERERQLKEIEMKFIAKLEQKEREPQKPKKKEKEKEKADSDNEIQSFAKLEKMKPTKGEFLQTIY